MTSTALLRHERSSLECVSDDDGPATRCNRRIIVPRYGGPDVMTVIQEPLPEPGPEEVRVRILVAGVGYPDVQIREGTYPGGPKPPFTPGYEFIGVVDKLGPASEPSSSDRGSAPSLCTEATPTISASPPGGSYRFRTGLILRRPPSSCSTT